MENHAISVESNSSGRLRRKEQLWHNSLLKVTPRRIPYETFDRIVLNISRRKKETKLISSSLTSRAVSSDLSPGFLLQHLSRIKKKKKKQERERERERPRETESERRIKVSPYNYKDSTVSTLPSGVSEASLPVPSYCIKTVLSAHERHHCL